MPRIELAIKRSDTAKANLDSLNVAILRHHIKRNQARRRIKVPDLVPAGTPTVTGLTEIHEADTLNLIGQQHGL